MTPAQIAAQIRNSRSFLSNGVREVTGTFTETRQVRGGLCITLDNGEKVHWRMSAETVRNVQFELAFPPDIQAILGLAEIDAETA